MTSHLLLVHTFSAHQHLSLHLEYIPLSLKVILHVLLSNKLICRIWKYSLQLLSTFSMIYIIQKEHWIISYIPTEKIISFHLKIHKFETGDFPLVQFYLILLKPWQYKHFILIYHSLKLFSLMKMTNIY